MQVFEITIDGGDELKESVSRLLCPDPDHVPPCPVPWSFDSVGQPLVVSVCVDAAADATGLAERIRAESGCPVSVAAARESAHPTLVEQYWTERGLRA
jgi:hypothetical protein